MPDGGNILMTVVVCTSDRLAFLRKAVASVLPQLGADSELLVVDNGSTDGTAEFLAGLAAHPGARFCREEQAGLSIARNTALREARGEFVIFLDDDAVADAGWLAGYGNFFSRLPHAKVGGAGGAVEPDFEVPPPGWMPACNIPEPETSRACKPAVESPWGCNVAVRREAALAAGGFNPRLGHRGKISGAYEEIDLQERIQRAGWEYWWVKGAGVRHFVEARRHMSLGWMLSSSFRMGRCRAQRRLGQLKKGRVKFSLVRVLVGPFHFLANAILALVSWPFGGGRNAAAAAARACGIAGFTWELLCAPGGRAD